MSLWLVRAGRYGEQEETALGLGLVTIGFDMPDLSEVKSKERLKEIYIKQHPDAAKMKAANEVGQVWRFVHDIKKGDLVALPLKTQPGIAIGKVVGEYEYNKDSSNAKHIRRVEWQKTIPRSDFDQDLLYALGAFMTVCQIAKNDAENRVIKLLKEGPTPPDGGNGEPLIDVERYAKDQIIKHIEKRFKGHDLARLVEALLRAQGYITKRSPPGPDGGVDILAGGGSLGFDSPRLCVQVKSSSSPINLSVLQQLKGAMSDVQADQGLIVAWGGFTGPTQQKERDAYFSVRFWDQDDILDGIFTYYSQFDDEIKADLPLKRIWSLVLEE
jgi:restriction system protein